MAAAFDFKSNTTTTSGTITTLAHTCNGAERVLLVFAANKNNLGGTVVTYAGIPMTKITNGSYRANMQGDFYFLAAPAIGTNDIVVTWTAGVTMAVVIGLSYTGCKQSGIPDANVDQQNSKDGTTSTINQTITTVLANSMIVAAQMVDQDWGTVVAQAPLTSRYDRIGTGVFSFNVSVGDYLFAGPGAQAVGFTVRGYESYSQQAISLAPVQANTAGVSRMFEVF